MATLTILKQKGVYSFEDFTLPRAALRLDELQSESVMAIARSGNNDPAVAYLISAAWYTGQLALLAAIPTPAPTVSIATKPDDFLGGNLSTLINLVNGTPQVASEQSWFNHSGSTFGAHKMFGFVRTAEIWEDPNSAKLEPISQEGGSEDHKVAVVGPHVYPDVQSPSKHIGGTILGYLISPDLYAILAAA